MCVLVSCRGMMLKHSRAKASPQWGLSPDQLIKQLKDGTEAAKEAIEQVTETLPRIQKVKHELANEGVIMHRLSIALMRRRPREEEEEEEKGGEGGRLRTD